MKALPAADEALAWLLARSMREFVADMWPIIEPGTTYRSNWHIDAICDRLEAVSAGEVTRLIINVPPRHMKSTSVSVAWPAWEWLTSPSTRFLCASYAERLAVQDSVKCRQILDAPGVREHGGTLLERVGYHGLLALLGEEWALTDDQNQKTRFDNTRRGYRIATSVGGTATGMGGDILLIDDPNSAADIESPVKRAAVLDWLDGTMSTRLNDPQTGRIVVVQQRLHEQDATGHLLAQGGWEHLCLPAEYDPKHPFTWPDDPRVKAGELLWPGHFTADAVKDLRVKLGTRRASGQLDQLPVPSEGGMFKREWWPRWTTGFEGKIPHGWDTVLQSWDMRFTDDKQSGDWVVGQLWGFKAADAYLLGQVRARLGFTESQQAMRDFTEWATSGPHGPFRHISAKLVEEKANGAAIIQTLRRELGGIVAINPTESKQARAAAVSPLVEAGNVHLPPGDHIPGPPGYEATSVATFIEECAGFPLATHDDQVDCMSQALAWRRPPAKQDGEPAPQGKRTRPVAAGVRTRAL